MPLPLVVAVVVAVMAAPPIPTPPPTPTDYPVSFYYGDRIDNFKACFDLNFNDKCDDNELSTTTFENPSNNDHSFVLSTNDTSLNNFLRQNKRPYLIEVNACDGCPPAAKSRHPGHLFLSELGLSTEVNMNTFTAAITPKFIWTNFPGWYFDDPNSGAAKIMEADIYASISNNLNLIKEYESISDAEFFGGIDSVNVMSSNRDDALSNRFFSYSFTSELRRLIANDYASIVSGSDNLFFGVSLEGKTPDEILVDFQPERRVFRSYLSSNFPNDTTGKYSSLSTSDRYTMPGFFDVKITFDDFIGNWDGNYTASGRTRLIRGASLYGSPLSASIPGESATWGQVPVYYGCDVADDNLCRHDATINGLFASAADAREAYRLDSHQGNIVDSYIDRYEIVNSQLSESVDKNIYYQYCWNIQAAQRSEVDYQNISGTVSDLLYRRIENYYQGSNQNGICYVSDRTIYSHDVVGLAVIAGQGDLIIALNGNNPDYFYDIPSVDPVISDLESRNSLDSASLRYINDIEVDLDYIETLVERTKEMWECGSCFGSLTVFFFPYGATSFNKFLLNGGYFRAEEVYCNVDYNGNYSDVYGEVPGDLFYTSNITDTVIQDVVDHCEEFLSWGWEFERENNLVRSPFMGGGVNANSASGLKPRNNSELSPEEKLELVRAHLIRR